MQILNLSTSAKPAMTKLQILFIEIVDRDIFQMTLKITLFTVDLQVKFLLKGFWQISHVDVCRLYAVYAPF